MDTKLLPFATFDDKKRLGVVPGKDGVTGASHQIGFQKERSPSGAHEQKRVYDSETNPTFNTNVRIRIPKENFVPSKHSYIRFKLVAAITGPTNPRLLPTFDALSNASPIRLLYNKRIVEEMTAKQIWYESTFHQSGEEKLATEKMQNEGTVLTRQTNNTNNVDYYIYLGKLLSNHIHLPTQAYASEWELQVRLDNLNKIVQGDTATAGVGTLSELQIVCHGHRATENVIASSIPEQLQGLAYHFHDATEIQAVVPASTLTHTFTFPSIRGSVSSLVFWAIDNAKFTSTDPSIIDKGAFSDLGEGEFQFGTTASNDKFTLRPQRMRMMRYNKGARESMGIYLNSEGTITDVPVYHWEFSQREQLDIDSGAGTGSVSFNGTEQIKLTMEAVPAPDVQLRYFFLFYQPTAAVQKGTSTSTTMSH